MDTDGEIHRQIFGGAWVVMGKQGAGIVAVRGMKYTTTKHTESNNLGL